MADRQGPAAQGRAIEWAGLTGTAERQRDLGQTFVGMPSVSGSPLLSFILLESFPRSMLPTIDSGTDRSLNCLFAFMSSVGINFQFLGARVLDLLGLPASRPGTCVSEAVPGAGEGLDKIS